MLIREVEREKAPLQFTLNLGMLIYLISYLSERIMGKKKIEQETFSMLCGFQTYLCRELKIMVTGPSFALMKPKDYSMSMDRNLLISTPSMKKKEREEKPSKPKSYGKPLLRAKWRLALPIFSLKIMLILNLTISTWEQLRALTSVVKLWSIPPQMK